MGLKVIWRKACLRARNPSKLSKDLGPKKERKIKKSEGFYEGGKG
jgi:hypothetical protein